MADDDATDDDYKVGNKRPPKHSQFKTGTSGNPNGRKPGSRGIKARLLDQLDEPVTIKRNGKTVKLTKGDVVALQLVDGAMRDPKTAATVMRIVDGGKEAPSNRETTASPEFASPNNEVLKRIRDRLNRKLGGKG